MVGISIAPIKSINSAFDMAGCVNQHKPSFMSGMFNHLFIIWRADIDRWIRNWDFAIKDIFEFLVVIFWKENVVMR